MEEAEESVSEREVGALKRRFGLGGGLRFGRGWG